VARICTLLIVTVCGCQLSDGWAQQPLPSQALAQNGAVTQAIAVLYPAQGGKVKGTVTFTKVEKGVQVVAHVEGLTPGMHGFHIHEFGDCSAPDATSAGSHFAPEGSPHGAPTDEKRHTGDLGNIKADDKGMAHLEWLDPHMSFTGDKSIIGRAVIVHEKQDDLVTQPTGNAGARLACGVIGVAKKQ